MKITTVITSDRTHVAAVSLAATRRLTAPNAVQVPGDSSDLRTTGTTGMTTARSGSSGWGPPS
jgi:hypothetical protein